MIVMQAKSKSEDASGVTTGIILSLRESLQNSKDTLVMCQNELEAAKLEIQNWHSTLKNEPSLPAGITSDPKVLNDYLQSLKSSVASLKQQIEKAKRKEDAFMVTFAKREKYMSELKSVEQDLKVQLKPPSMEAKRFLLDPAVREEFTRLKNLVDEKDRKVKELEDEITALSFTTQSKEGKMLIDKCRKLQAENEKLGEATSEEKIHEIESKLALQKLQNSQLKSHFEGLQKHMEGLTNDVQISNEIVLILQDKIEEKDREVQRLKNELQQKNLEDEDLMQK
ncbi:Pre-mRNA-splicing regulator WTAP [Vigna unguiculata]|uniref:Pre-mRNA-splicing regulator WTAP n=1 Tax=Vigna unguiculata TaxID=3917 RepID=A0A4D6NQW4_VIGUN|nr:Pre-mRNA-splicing regulator WTAP [Vigna unguiculata]